MKVQQTTFQADQVRAGVRHTLERSQTYLLASLCVAPALVFSTTAWSQDADMSADGNIAEVVVSSTRREMGVQDVPVAITAIGGEAAESLGLENLDELATLVPGLSMIDSGPWGNSTIIMRGVNSDSITGTGNETEGGGTVGVYLGETPLYADFKMLDINRVEALMGPQGTLYGAGTLAGAVRFVPNRPNLSEYEANLHSRLYGVSSDFSTGNQEDITVNIPLVDGKLAVRGAFGYYDDPGFVDYPYIVRSPGRSNPQPDFNDPDAVAGNLITGSHLNYEDTVSSRVSALWAPTAGFEGLLTWAHQKTQTGGRQINSVDSIGSGLYESGMRYAEPSSREADLFSLELTGNLGFAQLVSASSYSEQKIETIRDQTDLLLFLSDSGGYGYENFPEFVAYTTGDTDRDQFTEELRLVSSGDGPLSWIVGGFYNELDSVGTGIEYTPGLPAFFEIDRPDEMEYYSKTDLTQKEKAAYGEIGYRITDAWQVTIGGRYYDYTVEQTNATDLPLLNDGPYEFSPRIRAGETGDSGSLFKFNTSYDLTDDVMAFVTVSEGYRLGGFNAVAPCPDVLEDDQQYVCALPNERQYLPDKTLNKEIGIRSQWFDRSLTVNAAIYHIDWEDVQVAGITENGAIGITTNGAEAVSQGVEFAMQASLPMEFSILLNYTYTDAQLTKDAKGLVDDRFTLVRLDNAGSYLARYGTSYNPACDPSSASYESTPAGACAGDARDGDRLPGTPKHKGSIYLGWTRDFANDYQLRANYGISAQGDVFTKVGNRASGEALAGYATHSFNIGVEKGNWMVSLFGENIFDKYAETAVTNDSSFVFDAHGGSAANPTTSFAVRRYNKTIIRPQVFGVDFRMKFGM
jgi:iron complex outermembrane recepter protein